METCKSFASVSFPRNRTDAVSEAAQIDGYGS
jgi:hypothetical protein